MTLANNVDMMALGDWLEANVGPIAVRASFFDNHTPYSKGRLWRFDYYWKPSSDAPRLEIEFDMRKIKPHARTDFYLRWGS